MNHIDIIKSNSSFDIAGMAKAIISMVGIESVRDATIKDIFTSNVEEFPLVLSCSSSNGGELIEFEIRIRVLPLAYEGNEACELFEVLKYAGFKFEDEAFKKEFGFMRLEKEDTGG